MYSRIFLKLLPYLIIAVLGLALYFGFRYYANKIEDLTEQNTILQTQKAEVSNNYTTLQNMYSISMKQVEDLQKQQKESLEYVNQLKLIMKDIDLKKEYDVDSVALLIKINEYENCMAKHFKDPYYHCYGEKK